ncbi:MAG: hypothetical protein B5M53_03120 [Candidatus Cloacimonas sp. 4484_209]|nr:MAG: hypothetical protein B5M53_03120 [Candidatus Cloacimonas sp. 4484_209]
MKYQIYSAKEEMVRRYISFYTKETQGRILFIFSAFLSLKDEGKQKAFWSEKLILFARGNCVYNFSRSEEKCTKTFFF